MLKYKKGQKVAFKGRSNNHIKHGQMAKVVWIDETTVAVQNPAGHEVWLLEEQLEPIIIERKSDDEQQSQQYT